MTEPVSIPYKRWKSRKKGYTVVVTAVVHRRGAHGIVTSVTFLHGDKLRTCPAGAFLRDFEPTGARLRRKSVWQWILEKDPV